MTIVPTGARHGHCSLGQSHMSGTPAVMPARCRSRLPRRSLRFVPRSSGQRTASPSAAATIIGSTSPAGTPCGRDRPIGLVIVRAMEPIVAGYVVTGWKFAGRVRPWRHDHHAAGVGSHPCSRRRLHPYLLHCFGDRAISALREQLFLRTRRRSKPDARLRLSSIVHSPCRRRGSVTAVSGCCSCRMSSYCGEIRRYPTPVSVRT
jgi:hypothetical protein